MKIRGQKVTIKQIVCLFLYYTFLQYLPSSTCSFMCIGKISKTLRYICCKRIFRFCGVNVNIERKAKFGNGLNIEIGDNSGIGVNASIPNNTIIGKDVMMGPNCHIFSSNHSFESIHIPIIKQGFSEKKKTVIGDDVWIGRNVLMTPGRIIKRGSIIAAGCVLCKDFPAYSIIGGNPSRLIRSRI